MYAAVTKTTLPADSRLNDRVTPGDFLDCYETRSNMRAPDAAEIIVDFPDWAQWLVGVRNALTAPFGLLKDGPEGVEKIGAFPVEYSSDQEVIAGFNDRHLEFRVSVGSAEGKVWLATWVQTHNLGGRLYLCGIMPFHILIARNALARVARATGPDRPARAI